MTAHAPARPATALRLSMLRTRARAGLVGSIAITTALSIALLCGLLAWIQLDVRDALSSAIPSADSEGGWMQVQTRPADDTEAQDAAATALIASLFGDTVEVERRIVGETGGETERVAWRITPDRTALDGDAVLRLDRGATSLEEAFRDSEADVQGTVLTGTLGTALASAAQGVRASAAIAPVPVAIAGILVWFAVRELGRLLGTSRGREDGLLRARGLSRAHGAVLSLAESATIVVVASLIGFAVAVALLALRPHGAVAALATWPVAFAGALVLTITLAVAQSRAARAASTAQSGAGRVARAASVGAAALIVAGSAVLIWQSVSLRSLPADDPWRIAVTTLAPMFGVAAVGILSVLLFAPFSIAVARLFERPAGLSPAYPARQVARRVVAFSVAVALVAMAACGATLAATYIATWRTASTDSARLEAGTPLRADFSERVVTPADVQTAAAVDGVRVAAPAIVSAVVSGEVTATLVAVPKDALADIVLGVSRAAQPADLTAALEGDAVGLTLPNDATGLRLTGLSTAQAWSTPEGFRNDTPSPDAGGDLTARAWVADAAGTLALMPLALSVTPEGAGRRIAADGGLPEGLAPWRVVGIELSRGRTAQYQGEQVAITELAVSAVVGGAAESLPIELADVALNGWALRLPSTAMLWSAAGGPGANVPAVVTAAFAQQLGLAVGETTDIRLEGSGRRVTIEVSRVVDAVVGVGDGPGILADLDAVGTAPLVMGVSAEPPPEPVLPDQIWADGPATAAATLSEELGVPVTTPMDASDGVTAGLIMAWWVCALGGAVLAGVAFVALLTALTAQRAGEVLVLRAIGVPPRRQARMRGIEASVVVVLAAVSGAVGGIALSCLVTPGLAGSAVPGSTTDAELALDPWPLIGALGVIALALAVIVWAEFAALRRHGISTRLEEAAP